jgi:hypothetical protein
MFQKLKLELSPPHHLEKHVIPQVTAFCEGRYDENAVKILSSVLAIKKQTAETLLATIPRDVIVVSNRRDERARAY